VRSSKLEAVSFNNTERWLLWGASMGGRWGFVLVGAEGFLLFECGNSPSTADDKCKIITDYPLHNFSVSLIIKFTSNSLKPLVNLLSVDYNENH
jgi:hypothetical protein